MMHMQREKGKEGEKEGERENKTYICFSVSIQEVF